MGFVFIVGTNEFSEFTTREVVTLWRKHVKFPQTLPFLKDSFTVCINPPAFPEVVSLSKWKHLPGLYKPPVDKSSPMFLEPCWAWPPFPPLLNLVTFSCLSTNWAFGPTSQQYRGWNGSSISCSNVPATFYRLLGHTGILVKYFLFLS